MTRRSNRRLVVLFLATVLLPCAVLVSIAIRTVQREREFESMRADENRARQVGDLRRNLLTTLETARARAIANFGSVDDSVSDSFDRTAVRLVASARGDRLILDWERARPALPPGRLFQAAMANAEAAEFAAADPLAASRFYQVALEVARAPADSASARLGLGRALLAGGRHRDGISQYRIISRLSFRIVDEHGVPFAAYAASRLIDSDPQFSGGTLNRQVAGPCCVSAEGWYMVRSVLDSLFRRPGAAQPLDKQEIARLRTVADARAKIADQVAKLKSDFAGLSMIRVPKGDAAGSWTLYGSPPWFLAASRGEADGEIVVGLDAAAIIRELNATVGDSVPGGARLSLAAGPTSPAGSVRLSPEFPSLEGSFHPTSDRSALLSTPFFLGMLLCVVCVSLFGAYAVLYDVRRELRLSELRSHFVASVSHELKTPLTSIRMFAETILLGRTSSEAVRSEYLENIVHETERLTRLLNNVLDVSKIDRGEKIYRFADTSLPEVVIRCARTMEYPLEQHGLRLVVSADEELPPISADADALHQAIINLLANAMKYSNGSSAIDLRLRRSNGHAIVDVVDRGLGIPPEFLPRLVEKFYRVPSAENSRIPGTGLGLTLVDHIAKAHGGSLEIRSEPGAGTTVSLYLPLA
ncbi:MAG: ATP-binding protein [Gemmatimonadaceae bacterium]